MIMNKLICTPKHIDIKITRFPSHHHSTSCMVTIIGGKTPRTKHSLIKTPKMASLYLGFHEINKSNAMLLNELKHILLLVELLVPRIFQLRILSITAGRLPPFPYHTYDHPQQHLMSLLLQAIESY